MSFKVVVCPTQVEKPSEIRATNVKFLKIAFTYIVFLEKKSLFYIVNITYIYIY